MTRVCTVCQHANRDAIDAELVAGASYRALAGRFGLSRSAIERHKRDHVPRALAQSARAAEVARGDDLVDRLVSLANQTLEILAEARAAGDLDVAVKALARAEKQVELQARLLGELAASETTVNVGVAVLASPEWLQARARIVDALAPWPDAASAVVGALEG